MTAVGLLLAAGQGRRMGRPKALVHASDGSSWLLSSRARMLEAGCAEVLVVLGAEAQQAMDLLGDAWSIVAERWAEGMGESMRAGLLDLIAGPHDIALVHLVDLPDVDAPVMRRLLDGSDASSLKRAVYGGVPSHPVVVGRDHWQNLVDTLAGDTGAKEYLRSHGAVPVECGDLATGRDVDTPDGV
jgi:CTP:molybdopterin cytidylyltransferase MocA